MKLSLGMHLKTGIPHLTSQKGTEGKAKLRVVTLKITQKVSGLADQWI